MKAWTSRRLAIGVCAAVLLVGGARSGAATDEESLSAAQQHLQDARKQLQATPGDYGGQRKAALEHVEHAIARVKDAIKLAGKRDRKDERRTEQEVKDLEKKEKELERKLDKVEKKQDKLGGTESK